MKKSSIIVLALAVLLLLFVFASQRGDEKAASPELGEARSGIFDANDLVVNDVRFGESPEEIEKKLGKPKSVGQVETIPATGDEYYAARYDGLELWFFTEEGNSRSLRFAVITGPQYAGPRGLKVGDAKEAVTAAFPSSHDYEGVIPGVEILYAASVNEDVALPPSGEIERDESAGGEIVSYICPISPYEEETDIEDIYLDYVYLEHAMLWFEIEDGKVSQIHLAQGALAE